jgi:hypothetical protein
MKSLFSRLMRRTLGAMAVSGWLLSAGALAPAIGLQPDEHQVTVLKRDGSRVSGKLEGVGNGTVYVRSSQAEQHKIPVGDAVVIDFVDGASGLPETETAAARGAEHVMVLRDSTSVKGRLIETRGGQGSGDDSEPRIVYFQPSGSQQAQRYEADRVGRIYLGNYPAATAAPGVAGSNPEPAAGQEDIPAGAIRVPANQAWTATAISVREGDRLQFEVSGEIVLSGDPGDVARAAGSMKARKAPGAPLPANYAGCLIARVGNSPPFAIGNIETAIAMPRDGQLIFGINDDHVADNKGDFQVKVLRRRRGN